MRKALPWLVLLLALPAARGRDEPKKDDKPPPAAAKEQYDKLAKEYAEQSGKLLADARKAKGDEQKKLFAKKDALGKDFAEKMVKLAEENPKDAAATDAVFWVMSNSTSDKMVEKLVAVAVAEMPAKDLTARLRGIQATDSEVILEAVLKRAEKADDAAAAELLGWVSNGRAFFPPGEAPKCVTAAGDRLLEKFPDSPAVSRMMQMMVRGGTDGGATLKKIADTATSAKLKASATYGLGQNLAAQLDALGDKPEQIEKVAAEAEKVFAQAIELFDKEKLAAQKETAEKELTSFRTLRVGKEAPDIKGADLDGKDFKLTDYRGKVVLLDFWGNW